MVWLPPDSSLFFISLLYIMCVDNNKWTEIITDFFTSSFLTLFYTSIFWFYSTLEWCRYCRSDWPGLGLFCCYQSSYVVSQRSWVWASLFDQYFHPPPPPGGHRAATKTACRPQVLYWGHYSQACISVREGLWICIHIVCLRDAESYVYRV